MKRTLFCLLAASLSALIIGCGEKLPSNLPKIYPVNFAITYDDGTPVADAKVELQPETIGDWFFTAMTDSTGKAAMLTSAKYNGIPAGDYTVIVKKIVEDETAFPAPSAQNMDSAEYREWEKNYASEKRDIHSFIDQSYGAAATTPLKINVTKREDFTLKVGKKIDEVIGQTGQ